MKSDALEAVKEAAAELIKQAGNVYDPAVRGCLLLCFMLILSLSLSLSY